MSDEFVPYLKGDLDARQHRIYNLPDPVDNNEVATKAYVDAGGGSQPAWEAVTVPTDQASWTEYTGSGNWDFTDGVITYTNAGSGNSPVILTNDDNYGQAWAVECEVKLADHTSYQVAFNAGAWIYNAPSGQELNGFGFQLSSLSPGIDSDLVSTTTLTDTVLPDENWHTVRMVNLPLVRQVYFDGVLTGQAFSLEGGAQFQPSDGLKESRFLLFAANTDVGTQFRNLKAWRIPLPVFP